MSFFKKIMLAASLMSLAGFANAIAPPSGSQVINIGTLDQTIVSTVVMHESSPFMFMDTLNFSLADDFGLSSNVVETNFLPFIGVDIMSWDLFSVTDGLLSYTADVTSRLYGNLVTGDYYALVTGTVVPMAIGGSYTLNLVTAPVPEPSVIALMLGGLGLVGFMAARRRKA